MMKKGLCAVLSAGMIFSMLSGCGTDAAPKTGKENISQEEGSSAAEKDTMQADDKEKKSGERSEEFVSLGTSSSGGTFNTLGVALCQLWNDELASTTFSAEVTAGSSENCLRIGRGELQMAFAAASSVYEAYNGTGQFEGNKVDGISAVACLYPAVIQIPVLKSSGIKNIHDIKERKLILERPDRAQSLQF